MSPARISLPVRHAKVLLGEFDDIAGRDTELVRAVEALREAIQPSPKKRAVRRAVKAAKQSKRETKNAETAAIRRAVFARAEGRCELCRINLPSEMHHAFGRVRVAQSERNCLALCRSCHHDLTENDPSAFYWWSKVRTHFRFHGLDAEAAEAEREIARCEAKTALAGIHIGVAPGANAEDVADAIRAMTPTGGSHA